MDSRRVDVKSDAPTVFVVDDDSSIRQALALLLACEGLAAEAYPSAEAFLDAYRPEWPGCLVLDISMPGLTGLELQRTLAERQVHIPIIFLSGKADVPKTIRAFKDGAVDFLEKPASDEALLKSVRRAIAVDARYREQEKQRSLALAGVHRLTPRELDVLRLVVTGKSNKHIARELRVSNRTVEGHRLRVMEKMQARSLPDLIKMARSAGLIRELPGNLEP